MLVCFFLRFYNLDIFIVFCCATVVQELNTVFIITIFSLKYLILLWRSPGTLLITRSSVAHHLVVPPRATSASLISTVTVAPLEASDHEAVTVQMVATSTDSSA